VGDRAVASRPAMTRAARRASRHPPQGQRGWSRLVRLAVRDPECQSEEETWDDRKLDVLRAIVEDYVKTQEPVGSKALVERHRLGVSSATVRHDMAVLEEEGYLHQPHTSAGRVPTDKGYRLFVDRLSRIKPLTPAE